MAKSISKRNKHTPVIKAAAQRGGLSTPAQPLFVSFLDQALSWGLGLLCLFISICFYTGTYDTAFVKITLLQTGGIALTALWVALLLVQKRNPITRANLPYMLPFLAYFGWNIITYLFAPYKLDAFDEFLRYLLYGILSLMILDRFTLRSAHVLTKCIIIAAWISCGYGFMQVLDRWIPGVDIMPWHGFFGTRIFSTHANPNFFADFVVFSGCVVAAQYLRTRARSLLILLAIMLVDLFFSETKGAWIGFAVSMVFFVGMWLQGPTRWKKYTRVIWISAGIGLLGVGVLAGVYAVKRFQSVSFRAYTWAATLDMIQDSPIMGTGVGSFKAIYPAYRKPQIFYIENIHNNETQHAENEYLEQWATTGTIGLAIFLWLLFFVLYTGWRTVKDAPGPWEERTWLTVGYTAAFCGMCAHTGFDISIRFVSTGLFFAVFSALIVRLNMPPTPVKTELPSPAPAWLLWLMRVGVLIGLIWTGGYFISLFGQASANVGADGFGGALVKGAGWGVLLALLLGGAWVYIRAVWLAKWVRVPVVLLLSLWPLQWVYGFFVADHYYGIAAEFSRRAMFDGALDFYQKAISLNPLSTSLRQYRAYILRSTMDLERSYSPVKGDDKPVPGQTLLNDYDRVLRDLSIVEQRAPNNALLHQAYGEFYYTYAVHYTRLAQAEPLAYQRAEYEKKAVENMERAKQSFRRSLLIDPVNESTYVYLTSIAMMERNPVEAQYWIDAYRRGPEGVVEESFLDTHRHSVRLAQMEQQLRQPPFSGF